VTNAGLGSARVSRVGERVLATRTCLDGLIWRSERTEKIVSA
jgi:hypothetical protein